MSKANSVYEFDCQDNKGDIKSLSDFKGQVLLVVNTASKCGFTPQYEGLEKLYKEFSGQGLEILAFRIKRDHMRVEKNMLVVLQNILMIF